MQETRGEIPWGEILRSPPVWAIITAHACNNWANYTILICMPMYMKEVLHFDVKQVSMVHFDVSRSAAIRRSR